jgi:hypothetical protein
VVIRSLCSVLNKVLYILDDEDTYSYSCLSLHGILTPWLTDSVTPVNIQHEKAGHRIARQSLARSSSLIALIAGVQYLHSTSAGVGHVTKRARD